jgi:hypothetical protein
MTRKTDLETSICESYGLIREYEDVLRLTSDPKEKMRARRAIEEQQNLARGYLTEYQLLCQRLNLAIPQEIVEISISVKAPISPTEPTPPEPAPPAPAFTPASAAASYSQFALLVGIGAYQHIRPLSKTATDARDLHNLLAQSGYPAANLALLADEQASKATISDKLDWLARRAGPDDTVLIFFSGHGAQRIGGFEPGEYLCPVEADWYNLRSTAISNEELTTALRAIRAARVVVFLDACHSGGVGEPKDAAVQVKAGLSEQAYIQLAQGHGRIVIASCQPNEVSWELTDMRNGLFTHYLLEGLRGGASGTDGVVRVFELFDYLSNQVPRHKPQHPLFKGEIELNFAIV